MNLSTKDRIKKYRQTKDSRLRHEIIKENMNLVFLVVCKYGYAKSTGISKDELESYGYEGLIYAIDHFDIDSNNAFNFYAIKCIKGYILNGIQEIQFGKTIHSYFKILEAINIIEEQNESLISEELELVDKVVSYLVWNKIFKIGDINYLRRIILSIAFGNLSIEDTNESGKNLLEQFSDYNNEEETISRLDDYTMLEKLTKVADSLSGNEAIILKMRWGLYDGIPKTYQEIGNFFGVSRQRIFQIMKEIMEYIESSDKYNQIKQTYESENSIKI